MRCSGEVKEGGSNYLGKATSASGRPFALPLHLMHGVARGGQGKHWIGHFVASNMVALSLGTETDGSILFPANANSSLESSLLLGSLDRSGVVPISPRQDTVGTVSDAVECLDAIVGFDWKDAAATREASNFKMICRLLYSNSVFNLNYLLSVQFVVLQLKKLFAQRAWITRNYKVVQFPFRSTSACIVFPFLKNSFLTFNLCVRGLQDKIQLVPIDLWKRHTVQEKAYPKNKVDDDLKQGVPGAIPIPPDDL
ncbi:hypothetical protein Syun_001318 [Stephania yunnanensis]|uniref:Amidase domain-containing protein n=1 Tax=Stephania yunnanensis TaxID=152371 RepID=A0AAP0Q6Z7_9MAGN